MMIHEITEKVGRYKTRKRVGRGEGSGRGKTSTRGHKGARSRAGFKRRPGFEGGQMPLFRRMPKRGFSNARFRRDYHIVNLKALQERMVAGAEITPESLLEEGLIRDLDKPVKILGEGSLTKKLSITAAKFSTTAREKIEQAGGTVTVIVREKWTRERAKAAKAEA